MKRRVLLAVFLSGILASLSPALVHADVAEAARLFDEGNAHYAVGNYTGALESYAGALNQGFGSAALFYNMGNAYYRTDELGEAIRAYERARRLAPDDPEILHNLAITRDRTVDHFSRLPVPYWQRAWDFVVRSVGTWGLFGIGLGFWLIAAMLIIQRTLTGTRNPWLRRALAVSVVLGGVGLIAAFGASIDREMSRSGVVLASQTDLRAEPETASPVDLTVHEGAEVDILRHRDEWMLVRLPNGVRGWTSSSAIGEISL